MKHRIAKIILLIVGVIVGVPILWFGAIIAFYSITNPTMSFKPINEPINDNVISAKQIGAYLSNEIQNNDKLSKLGKYDLTIGSIDMKIDREHRGEVTVAFTEPDSKRPKSIYAYLNTREKMLYKFEDVGRESKLYPGIIHLEDWKIDSTDAVRISEECFRTEKNFRYDEIWLMSYSGFLMGRTGDVENWLVSMEDKENKICYDTRIDPYTGEVLSHTIRSG